MKCEFCGGSRFVAHQLVRMDVVVDENGEFLTKVSPQTEWDIYDAETPYGPYTCCKCGAVYDELADGEQAFEPPQCEEYFIPLDFEDVCPNCSSHICPEDFVNTGENAMEGSWKCQNCGAEGRSVYEKDDYVFVFHNWTGRE